MASKLQERYNGAGWRSWVFKKINFQLPPRCRVRELLSRREDGSQYLYHQTVFIPNFPQFSLLAWLFIFFIALHCISFHVLSCIDCIVLWHYCLFSVLIFSLLARPASSIILNPNLNMTAGCISKAIIMSALMRFLTLLLNQRFRRMLKSLREFFWLTNRFIARFTVFLLAMALFW